MNRDDGTETRAEALEQEDDLPYDDEGDELDADAGEYDDYEEDDEYEDDRAWNDPAPVVTDEGVFGRLPDRQRAFREYQRQERPWGEPWTRLSATLLALTGGIWLLFFSASEATSAEVARPALESITDTLVGLPDLLELHATEISAASGAAEVPGYPLPVTIPADEVSAGPERWREVVLEQSSAILYAEGPDAFAPDGGAGGGGTFSTTGGTKLLMGNLTAARHDGLQFLLWPLGIAALVGALGVVAMGSSFGRYVTLGIATAAAGLPAIVLGVLAWLLVAFVGSDGSALAETSHRVAADLAWLPIQNGLTLLFAGFLVALAARLMGAVFRPARPPLTRREPALEE